MHRSCWDLVPDTPLGPEEGSRPSSTGGTCLDYGGKDLPGGDLPTTSGAGVNFAVASVAPRLRRSLRPFTEAFAAPDVASSSPGHSPWKAFGPALMRVGLA